MPTPTTNYAFQKPTVGGDSDVWGGHVNDALDGIDRLLATANDPDTRIINGAFDHWQRGTSHSTLGYGSADRWFNGFNGGTVTQSRQSLTVGDTFGANCPTFFLQQSVSGQTLSSHYAATLHNIEGARTYAGQTITILGWVRRSSGSGNMAVEVSQNFGTGGSPSSPVNSIGVTTVTLSGTWQPFAVTVSVPSVAGKTFGTNGNDFLGLVFWTSAGADYNARTNSLGLQTINVDLWGVHVRLGTHTTASALLYRAPEAGPELARCQRYYQVIPYRARWQAAGGSDGDGRIVPLPVTMRATPSTTATVTNSVNVNNVSFGTTTASGLGVEVTPTASGATDYAATIRLDAEI